MIKIKKFIFNQFQVNTYVLYDETKECVIIDAGCNEEKEKQELIDYIETQELKPVRLLYTHCHIDHIIGNTFVAKKYDLLPEIHQAGLVFLQLSKEHAESFGFEIDEIVLPKNYINEKDIIKFGNSELETIYTPGHADGSICFINKEQKVIFSGDVLFYGSIGRTDLPTGNYKLLMENINSKLLVFDDDFTVYCGHGSETSIGFERKNNPYFEMDI